MDFGISLDPSAVAQRHCLEDSDEEEEDEVDIKSDGNEADIFTVPEKPCTDLGPGVNIVIFTIGLPASIFIKSYLNLESIPSFKVTTSFPTVFKDKFFTTSAPQPQTVDEVFEVQNKGGKSEKFLVCVHKQQLTPQHCNLWCNRVSVYINVVKMPQTLQFGILSSACNTSH